MVRGVTVLVSIFYMVVLRYAFLRSMFVLILLKVLVHFSLRCIKPILSCVF